MTSAELDLRADPLQLALLGEPIPHGRRRADRDLAATRRHAWPRRRNRSRDELTAGLAQAGWHVLHDLPVYGSGTHIAHLAIGPGGVFAVDVHDHRDAFVFTRGDTFAADGRLQPHIPNARFHAERAARLLSVAGQFAVDVTALVAVVGAERGLWVREQPHDGRVAVVYAATLADQLLALPAVLDAPSAWRIHEVARHLATWQPTSVRWDDLALRS